MQDVHMKLSSGLSRQKQHSSTRRLFFFHQFGLKYLRKKLTECCICSLDLYGAESWTFCKVDQKYLESFDTCCWRRMEKVNWTDRVKHGGVLHRVKEERNVQHTLR